MKGLLVLVVLAFVVGVFSDVQIASLFTPEDCTVRAKPGDTVKVHYTGKLTDQQVFDSSAGRDPLEFELGAGRVIPGWEKGISGMCVGEKRLLTIPPELAYGDQAVGPIPAKSTLIFETELVEISNFGAGVPEQAPAATSASLFSRGNIGFLAIIGGFFLLVTYLVKAKPELGGSSGPRRSSKSGSSNKLKRSR